MGNPLISVILPCYNVTYLFKALESVFTQSYPNWECLLIDDGSTDNTANIATEWVNKDTRFKYHYQDNQGLSGARNSGLSMAKGKFVYFFDPDDLIDAFTLESLIALADKDIDIVFGKNAVTKGQSKDIIEHMMHSPKPLKKHYNTSKSLLKLVIEEPLICVAWNRLYRKSFLEQNKLVFKKGILHEDELWFFETLFHSNAIILNDKVTYYYNVANVNSITNNFYEKNLESYLTIAKQVYNNYYLKERNKPHLETVAVYLTYLKIKTINHCYKKLSKSNRQKVAPSIKTVFKNTPVYRKKRVLSNKLEKLHYIFNLTEVLSPTEQLNALRYEASPKGLRPLKKLLLLKKAQFKNKKMNKSIIKLS
jgi:glycosyltransferase involved in cell wall biosynthesis